VIASDFGGAFRTLAAAPLRTALTLLGVVMSTSSFVLLVSLIQGGTERLTAANQEANDGTLVVVDSAEPPHGAEHRTRRELSRGDARVLGQHRAIAGAAVAAEQHREVMASIGERKKRVSLVSATEGARELYHVELQRGRFLRAEDLAERRRVCVIGYEIWQELFRSGAEPSRELHIETERWSVVGVLADKPSLGGSDSTNMWNRRILVPETAFDAAYNPSGRASKLLIRPPAEKDAALAGFIESITSSTLLRLHYGVKNFNLPPKQGQKQGELIFAIVRVLLVGTAVVSLFVGGINVMNIMLVTVTERTREIGIRRAVGASPRAIRRQFLIEATTLTTLGGLFGVTLGAALAALAAVILRHFVGQWSLHIELWAVLVSLGLSIGTGLFFGLYPARKAAAVDVIVALRSD
jgi:putative ABC transport system permease protein